MAVVLRPVPVVWRRTVVLSGLLAGFLTGDVVEASSGVCSPMTLSGARAATAVGRALGEDPHGLDRTPFLGLFLGCIYLMPGPLHC